MLASFKASLLRMEYARFLMVLLIVFGKKLLAMQNFKLRPSSCFVFGGRLPGIVRSWKVKLVGSIGVFKFSFLMAVLKFCRIDEHGLA